MPVSLILTLMSLALSAHIVADWRGWRGVRAVGKIAASTGFLLLAWGFGTRSADSYGVAVLAALALCWVGDLCLLSRRTHLFMLGIGAFLLGHVAFAAAFIILGVDWGWVAGAAIVAGTGALVVNRWLGSKVDAQLRVPVRAYTVVITAMVALAVGCFGAGRTWLIPSGATAFFVSDLAVARDRFVIDQLRNRVVGLPLYYTAQVMLAASLVI